MGHAIAGDVGAIIAGKEKITQKPIKRREEETDNRKLNLYVNQEDDMVIYDLDVHNYEYLKYSLPEKEYEHVLATGGLTNNLANQVEKPRNVNQKLPEKGYEYFTDTGVLNNIADYEKHQNFVQCEC